MSEVDALKNEIAELEKQIGDLTAAPNTSADQNKIKQLQAKLIDKKKQLQDLEQQRRQTPLR
jgi:septal ring factor EnvC (AmiA/AmiB activator)